jgi:LmbE family N-acetylglucosaminyl deacetylase
MSTNSPLQIIVFGAHPDDCELFCGGTAALFVDLGHEVTFVSLTNGDSGHHLKGGGDLTRIRYAECMEAKERLGLTNYFVLDNHDGELQPTLELRKQIVRLIRRHGADLVFTHRPNDYHPDHRYGSIAVQDAAYTVMVPNICPDTPPLRRNPVFFYLQDRFRKPYPFVPDVSIDVSSVWERKLAAGAAHVSQFGEWLPWVDGYEDKVSKDPVEASRQSVEQYALPIDPEVRDRLRVFYGEEAAEKIQHAESFELCEYGGQPDEAGIRRLFPMLPQKGA